MPVLHMQTEAVRATGQQINQTSESLRQQAQQLRGRTQQLANEWQGPSASMFEQEMQVLLQQAGQSAETGGALNQKVQKEVDEWERVAADLGGGEISNSTNLGISNTNFLPVGGETDTPFINYMNQFAIKQKGETCSATCQVMILKALGYDVSMDDIKRPTLHGLQGLNSVLNGYGVETEDYGTRWGLLPGNQGNADDAEQWLLSKLENRQGIVIGVEQDILYGRNDSISDDGHAIVITGVRYDENGKISFFDVLDPALGKSFQFPKDMVMDAWSVRGFQASATKQSINISGDELVVLPG